MNLIELYNTYTNTIEIYDTDTEFGMDTWEHLFKDRWTALTPFHTISTFNHLIKGIDEERHWNVFYKYTVSYTADKEGNKDSLVCVFGDKDIEVAGGIFNVLANHIQSNKIKTPWEIEKREVWIKLSYYKTLQQLDLSKEGE